MHNALSQTCTAHDKILKKILLQITILNNITLLKTDFRGIKMTLQILHTRRKSFNQQNEINNELSLK